MMVYVTSVDSQGTLLSTTARVNPKMLHILLLAMGRDVETTLSEIVVPDRLL